jgi:hypothetical protein
MSESKIELQDDRTSFEPGEQISGRVTWEFDSVPRKMELRLFWFTRGKGTEDVQVENTVEFENPRVAESRTFQFCLPESPFSFSGKLISLIWAIELVAQPVKAVSRLEIVVAPGGQEVLLNSLPESEIKKTWFAWNKG